MIRRRRKTFIFHIEDKIIFHSVASSFDISRGPFNLARCFIAHSTVILHGFIKILIVSTCIKSLLKIENKGRFDLTYLDQINSNFNLAFTITCLLHEKKNWKIINLGFKNIFGVTQMAKNWWDIFFLFLLKFLTFWQLCQIWVIAIFKKYFKVIIQKVKKFQAFTLSLPFSGGTMGEVSSGELFTLAAGEHDGIWIPLFKALRVPLYGPKNESESNWTLQNTLLVTHLKRNRRWGIPSPNLVLSRRAFSCSLFWFLSLISLHWWPKCLFRFSSDEIVE